MAHPAEAVVWLVPHTHWDREWYEPFQRFRLRLVDLMDDVTTRALHDREFAFTMDGQVAAVDDYLEVRPERRDVVRHLVATGQLAVGPWRVLMDEFLCSGETMLRNLEMGIRDAARLGPVMMVGYLPDMFGHCAQMPQLLRHVGLEQAVVYRGVPRSVDHHEFWWQAPDGTGIRTEYLAGSYGNASDLFTGGAAPEVDGAGVAARLRDRLAVQQRWFGSDDFLAMYGTDHAAPLPNLMDQVAALQQVSGAPPVRVATLGDYLATTRTPRERLRVVGGELRSHARANILPGVLSVRWHLKAAMAAAERLLARYAEPWSALLLDVQPSAYLELAWRDVIDSSCHDSVTGCGVDETAVQVQARIAEGAQAAQAVRDRALAVATRQSPRGSLVIANPLPHRRIDLVECVIPVPSAWTGVALRHPDGSVGATQEIARPERVLAAERVRSDRLSALMHRVHDRELFGLDVLQIEIDEPAHRLVFHVGDFHVGDSPVGDHRDEPLDAVREELRLAEVARRAPAEQLWEVTTLDEPRRHLVAEVQTPPLGWAAVVPVPAEGPLGSVVAGSDRLDNGLVSVVVSPDGSLTVTSADGTRLAGVARLVDGGDCGDSYNYGPPADDRLVDAPTRVSSQVAVGPGPLVGALLVTRCYELPTGLADGSRSATTEPVVVTMRVELRRGEPFVRLELDWENRSRDHRLRLHVPLARRTETSQAQGQLAVIERGLTAEGGPVGEEPVPTFPAERFVDAGGAGVLLTRTMEYEVVSGPMGQELAVTLLRAVGYLSRNVHPYRSEPAGPQLPTPEAQVIGPARAALAVVPHAGDWAAARVGDLAEHYLHPVVLTPGVGGPGAEPRQVEGLSVSGDGIDLLSLRRRGTALEARIVNSADHQGEATLGSARRPLQAAHRCDGVGRTGEDLVVSDGQTRITLRPWEIVSVQLDLPASG